MDDAAAVVVSKKRTRSSEEGEGGEAELEIDVTADEPLSKRAARRLKKGRSLKQAPSSSAPLPDAFHHDDEDDDTATLKSSTKTRKEKSTPREEDGQKGTNGIWIGNLSFRTTETDLTTFFSTLRPLGKTKPASAFASIATTDLVRISLPVGEKRGQANRGFAYIDFATPEQRDTAIALSERILHGRNVLIKSAQSFDGRPTPKTEVAGTKILYVGNLSFDVTSDDLERYLGGSDAGIKKVRMATFEDSGKCKGFAFVDFDAVERVSAILKNKKLHNMNGRKLKMEFGEDRSLRRKPPSTRNFHHDEDSTTRGDGAKVDPRSIKPGQALMSAQRASHAIVPGQGVKQNFD